MVLFQCEMTIINDVTIKYFTMETFRVHHTVVTCAKYRQQLIALSSIFANSHSPRCTWLGITDIFVGVALGFQSTGSDDGWLVSM